MSLSAMQTETEGSSAEATEVEMKTIHEVGPANEAPRLADERNSLRRDAPEPIDAKHAVMRRDWISSRPEHPIL